MVIYRMETQTIAPGMTLECLLMTEPNRAKANLDPVTVFAALSSPTRWRLMQMMADGKTLSATQAADAFGRQLDGLIKHLQILRDAGLVNPKYKEQDRRSQLYYIPEVWRTKPEVLDFGFCILDLSVTRR
jgi:DNA-binding transcriptional ArsR family regulator